MSKFWSTQPVLKLEIDDVGQELVILQISNEEIPLNKLFKWDEIDITLEQHQNELLEFIKNNYIEKGKYKIEYDKSHLIYSLTPPKWKKEWHLCVRVQNNNKLVAFISAIPYSIIINNKKIKSVYINYLSIHHQLRNKKLAPLLIKEITRRVKFFKPKTLTAIYTAAMPLPIVSLSKSQYYHRYINIQKLVDSGFITLNKNTSIASATQFYKIDDINLKIRPIRQDDIYQIKNLFDSYFSKYEIVPYFNLENIKHYFLNNNIYTYVCVDSQNQITDLTSFYLITYQISDNIIHSKLNIAHSFYFISTKTSFKKLINKTLFLAQELGCDVFNCLNIMNLEETLKKQKFCLGTGELNYYLYNWSFKKTDSKNIALSFI